MAITKILARKGRLDVGIRYVLNGDKTQEQILTARLNCDPGHECRQMLETKRAVGKEGGVPWPLPGTIRSSPGKSTWGRCCGRHGISGSSP